MIAKRCVGPDALRRPGALQEKGLTMETAHDSECESPGVDVVLLHDTRDSMLIDAVLDTFSPNEVVYAGVTATFVTLDFVDDSNEAMFHLAHAPSCFAAARLVGAIDERDPEIERVGLALSSGLYEATATASLCACAMWFVSGLLLNSFRSRCAERCDQFQGLLPQIG